MGDSKRRCFSSGFQPWSLSLEGTRAFVAASLLLLFPHGASGKPIRFRDISHSSGIDSRRSSLPEKRYILEMMGGGVALFDCDNDGKLDIVTVNDSTVDEYQHGGGLMIALYRQDSELHFSDTTVQSGLTTRGWGMGVTIGDFDNDGLPDIYVTGYRHNVLYRNLGGCKFEDVTERAHLSGGGFSVGAAWADYDFGSFVCASVAPVLTGFILDHTHSFALALTICAGVTLSGALSYALVVRSSIASEAPIQSTR
jgi:FG-GAP-like repeat